MTPEHDSPTGLVSAAVNTPPLSPAQFFGDPGEHHACCDCCEGYCPAPDLGIDRLDLFRVEVNGATYLTDRYKAIRADLIQVGEADRRFLYKDHKGKEEWPVPEVEPGPSRTWLRPADVERLLDCGIDIRQGGDGPRERQHLYVDGEHVGWLMPCTGENLAHIKLAEVPRIRSYVAAAEHGDSRIVVEGAEHPWDSAAVILHEADRIAALTAGGPRG